MNYSITEVHEGLYIVILVDIPEDAIDSIREKVAKNQTFFTEVRNIQGSTYSYSVFEVFGKNIESTLEIITHQLNELIL